MWEGEQPSLAPQALPFKSSVNCDEDISWKVPREVSHFKSDVMSEGLI